MGNKDKYVYEMDWATDENLFSISGNYRTYQFDLIKKYIGKNILEVGTGCRSFTKKITNDKKDINRLVSIEPSTTIYNMSLSNYTFPDYVEFLNIDLFDLHTENNRKFDTIIFIHVLEHIENDKAALDKAYDLVSSGGYVLLEVPALQWLYSEHDKTIGHYRRYNKKLMKSIIDTNKFRIIKLWYQDPLGVIGSFIYFKLRNIKLKSNEGVKLVAKQGKIYDNIIIPIEKFLERFVRFPFGLSLTCILEKK